MQANGPAFDNPALTGWFEAPRTCDASFFLRLDAGPGASLVWSGNESVAPAETLAVASSPYDGLYRDDEADPSAPPVLVEVWDSPSWRCAPEQRPCAGEMEEWGGPTTRFLTTRVHHDSGKDHAAFQGKVVGDSYAVRYTGWFQAKLTGELAFKLDSAMGSVSAHRGSNPRAAFAPLRFLAPCSC